LLVGIASWAGFRCALVQAAGQSMVLASSAAVAERLAVIC